MSAQFTPGPWKWFGSANNHEVYLATTHSGRRYVMGFKRWGMRGAQPTFQPAKAGLVPAADLLTFEVGDRSVRGVKEARENTSVYRTNVSGIDCADAYLIAASPALYAALEDCVERLRTCARLHGNGKDIIDQMCAPFDAALALARGEAA
jgi:hypothetical protein